MHHSKKAFLFIENDANNFLAVLLCSIATKYYILTYRNNPSNIPLVIFIFYSVRPSTDRILMK